LVLRLNSCQARWGAASFDFLKNGFIPLPKLLDAKLVSTPIIEEKESVRFEDG
jgi:hypothetical protein